LSCGKKQLKDYLPTKLRINMGLLSCLHLDNKSPGNASTDYALALTELKTNLLSGDSLMVQCNAGIVSWRIRWTICFCGSISSAHPNIQDR